MVLVSTQVTLLNHILDWVACGCACVEKNITKCQKHTYKIIYFFIEDYDIVQNIFELYVHKVFIINDFTSYMLGNRK